MPATQRLPQLTSARDDPQLALLREGRIEIMGRLVDASNVTLYCSVHEPAEGAVGGTAARRAATCVYKPIRGERPLEDFPIGTLAYREVAAYAVSVAGDWDIVPPTVLRDGPVGPGMVQLWMDVDETADVLELILTADPRLRSIALFDAVVNNADRKGGHLLPLTDGRIRGCDHGVCFAVEAKLRTVLWGWRGEPLTAAERSCLERVCQALAGPLGGELGELLSAAEVAATTRRVERLLATGILPLPDPRRPAIPWPPF